ncbi:glycoside hydrolase family 99-like domain-containing protein [Lachnospiraceae bacterium YH-ros2228]
MKTTSGGGGFTDWVSVKAARPLFDGHEQPNVSLNGNYYDSPIVK